MVEDLEIVPLEVPSTCRFCVVARTHRRDTFQLEYRIVWNPEAKKQIDERGETGPCTSSRRGSWEDDGVFDVQMVLFTLWRSSGPGGGLLGVLRHFGVLDGPLRLQDWPKKAFVLG